MRKDEFEIISEWKNQDYPTDIFCIVRTKKFGLSLMIKRSWSLFGPTLDSFIDYEKLLWSAGWRKQPLQIV